MITFFLISLWLLMAIISLIILLIFLPPLLFLGGGGYVFLYHQLLCLLLSESRQQIFNMALYTLIGVICIGESSVGSEKQEVKSPTLSQLEVEHNYGNCFFKPKYNETILRLWKYLGKYFFLNGCIISVVPYEYICASFSDLDCLQGGKNENHNEICIFTF